MNYQETTKLIVALLEAIFKALGVDDYTGINPDSLADDICKALAESRNEVLDRPPRQK